MHELRFLSKHNVVLRNLEKNPLNKFDINIY